MVQEVTTKSWGSRIVGAFMGVIIGFALIIGAFVLVFWNEGNSLHAAQSLEEVSKALVIVKNEPVDPKNDMQVVYTNGLATTDETLQDEVFNVSVVAIALDRQVSMYQWEQDTETKTEKQVGGSEQEVKTYTYKKAWSDDLINSDDFKDQTGHHNPSSMPISNKTKYASKVTLGAFVLPIDMVKEIVSDTTADLSKANLPVLKTKFKKPAQLEGDTLYFGNDSQTPEVGDFRVTIKTVLPQSVSVIAQQINNTFQPYVANAGKAISLIEMGQISPGLMIHNAAVQNEIMTWILRLVSFVMFMIGFSLIMNPIVVLADVIPFFGSLVNVGTTFVAFVCSVVCWFVSVSIAWFAFRPFWAIWLLSIAAIIIYLGYEYKKHKKAKS